MRLGWVVAPEDVIEQIVIAKQASDLHSNYLSQRIACEYLAHTDIDAHIKTIQDAYRHKSEVMQEMITKEFPPSVTFTHPQGGMFIWLTLPDGISSMEVFDAAIREQVAVLPGTPFFIDGGGNNTLRINFSNSTDEKIREGITRLARVIKNLG